jgi:saccharopine dehydrogenase-like protein
VLVLGGYGAFGGRIAERLARNATLRLIVAGRSLERARSLADSLTSDNGATVVPAALDAARVDERELRDLQATILINASGPYQWQDYRLARTCIAAGTHYIDLADARAFVAGIADLDAEARRAGVLIVSGASTVPAVSAAVLDELVPQLASLASVEIVIAPGNSFDPGLATTQSILSMLGRPYVGTGRVRHGWQGLRRVAIPGLGARWLGACETPDLDLLPRRYPGLRDVEVFAALEIDAFHLGLWGLSWLVRAGLVRHPERLSSPLLRLKYALGGLGSDVGGMMVTLAGVGQDGGARCIVWRLIARSGHGPYIPGTPSVILAKQLLAGTLAKRGAMPCLGLFTLGDFLSEVGDLDMTAGIA